WSTAGPARRDEWASRTRRPAGPVGRSPGGPSYPRLVGGAGERTDAIVIGGGVIGLGLGWRAARGGVGVARGGPAPLPGASSVAAGILGPVAEVGYGEEPLLR